MKALTLFMAANPSSSPSLKEAVLWGLPILLLLIAAIASLPHIFYVILRITVSMCGMIALITSLHHKDSGMLVWVAVFTCLVILYNPIVPLHFERTVWTIANISTAILFLINFSILHESSLK